MFSMKRKNVFLLLLPSLLLLFYISLHSIHLPRLTLLDFLLFLPCFILVACHRTKMHAYIFNREFYSIGTKQENSNAILKTFDPVPIKNMQTMHFENKIDHNSKNKIDTNK